MSIHQAMPILVAEDSEAAALIVRKLLWQVGLKNVDTAPDGLAALVKMSEKKYDLVIADWQMEPMSGYELLKHPRRCAIRRDPRHHHGGRAEDRAGRGGKEGGRQQLYRQALHRRRPKNQDRRRVPRIRPFGLSADHEEPPFRPVRQRPGKRHDRF
jgi:hypothetical protein